MFYREQNIKIGDKFILNYLGRKYPYEAKKSAIGKEIVLIGTDPLPFGVPLNALPVTEMEEYNFERVSDNDN